MNAIASRKMQGEIAFYTRIKSNIGQVYKNTAIGDKAHCDVRSINCEWDPRGICNGLMNGSRYNSCWVLSWVFSSIPSWTRFSIESRPESLCQYLSCYFSLPPRLLKGFEPSIFFSPSPISDLPLGQFIGDRTMDLHVAIKGSFCFT